MHRSLPLLIALLCLTTSAEAQESARKLTIGLGAGLAPEFEGSKSYKIIPIALVRYEDEDIAASTTGPGIEVDVIPSRKLDFGPILKADFGRKGGIDDPVVRLLPRVGTGIEVGAFIATGLPLEVAGVDDPTILTIKLSGTQDIASGHKGAQISGALGAVRPLGERVTLIGSASLTWASRNYMGAFFDVTPAASVVSGLPVYRASGGLKDFGLTAVTNVQLSAQPGKGWSATAIVSGKRLIGDAAQSPIVRLRGTRNLGFLGLSLNYQIF
jgi:MipA family protein